MSDRVLPTGTVTFLFSDMAGSTRLVQEVGPAVFAEILERHNDILRTAFARHGGVERGTQGDSFLVMFGEAPAAVAAAAEAQAALAGEAWPRSAGVRVRMGLHTGVGRLGGDDYVGIDVNRAARVAAAAHGGQVLLSEATRTLAEGALPAGTLLRNLGEHRLKDIAAPEHLHQLVIEGVASEFPAPLTLGRSVGNLPVRLTSFVGRHADLAAAGRLLDETRLLTLTGPGGTGKTSLAVELAGVREADYEHGAWFVSLEAVDDPDLVAPTIATAFGLVETPGLVATERLREFLDGRSLLLVIDNFEHVLPAAPLLTPLLRAASGLRIIVTSRAPLRLAGEQEFPVSPLSLDGATPESDAVRLFVERAGRVRPGYDPGEEAPAVVEICRRLDGLPLGIELAASRIGLLPARAIADRLAQRLDLPGGGPRDLPERRRTLQGAIAWSHDLLTEPEQRLLARLSVFAGGWRLEEAEAVCGPEAELGIELIDGLSTLVEQSLVQAAPGPDGARFRMLETIQMFAAERLAERGETDELRRRHALAYLALAEAAAQWLPGNDQRRWLDRLVAEHDNLRVAVAWAIAERETEAALRLGAALWRYWQMRGHLEEGRAAMAAILALPGGEARSPLVMRALDAAGGLDYWSADMAGAHAHYVRQVELAREIGTPSDVANALFNRSFTARLHEGDAALMQRFLEEARVLYAEAGDARGEARLMWTASINLITAGQLGDAVETLERARNDFVELDDIYYRTLVTDSLAWASAALGDVPGAMRWGIDSLRSYRALGDVAGRTVGLIGAAILLEQTGLYHQAATVRGAFDALCHRYGVRPPTPLEQIILPNWSSESVAATIGAEAFEAARTRGAAMTLDEVVDYVIGTLETRLADAGPGLGSQVAG